MALDRREFRIWLQTHLALFDRPDWPRPKLDDGEPNPAFSACFGIWRQTLEEDDPTLTVDELMAASKMLVRTPPLFRDAHPKALMEQVKELRKKHRLARAAAAAVKLEAAPNVFDPSLDRDTCESKSRDCPECDGQGYAVRFFLPEDAEAPERGVLYCRCLMGRWMHYQYSTKWPDIHARTEDLQSRPELWDQEIEATRPDRWVKTHPDEDNPGWFHPTWVWAPLPYGDRCLVQEKTIRGQWITPAGYGVSTPAPDERGDAAGAREAEIRQFVADQEAADAGLGPLLPEDYSVPPDLDAVARDRDFLAEAARAAGAGGPSLFDVPDGY
jgi:hypothetical protein